MKLTKQTKKEKRPSTKSSAIKLSIYLFTKEASEGRIKEAGPRIKGVLG